MRHAQRIQDKVLCCLRKIRPGELGDQLPKQNITLVRIEVDQPRRIGAIETAQRLNVFDAVDQHALESAVDQTAMVSEELSNGGRRLVLCSSAEANFRKITRDR